MWTWAWLFIEILTTVSAACIDIEPRSAFISCLKKGNSSAVLMPSSTGYNSSAQANWNLRVVYQPAAIVYPKTPQDVQKYVVCGAAFGVAVVGRSGGHSYALYGVGGQDGSLVIDLSNMKKFSIDASGSARIQTGNRLGDIAQKLWDNGQRALPHGVCPYVGLGGHTAFGGFGPYSRVAGLLQDRATSAEVVLANGALTTVSATNNPDLFWALRGAGASYGIVTEWKFATLAAPPSVISYSIDYTTTALSPSQIAQLMQKWQSVALSAPNELSVICTIGHFSGFFSGPNGTIYLQYRGTYYGTQTDFDTLTSNWTSMFSPGNFTSQAHNWYDGLVALGGPLATNTTQIQPAMYAKSMFSKSAISTTQWTSLLNYLGNEGLRSDVGWYIETDRYGGGVSNRPADATSFAHRDALLCFQLVSILLQPPFPADGFSFLDNALNALEPNPQAAYTNYVDPRLTPVQWKSQYYGSHYSRLSSIKRAVDPHNVFRFPQSIGLTS